MRKNSGNTLVEYSMFLGLLLLALLPALYAASDSIQAAFADMSKVFAANQVKMPQQLNPEVCYDLSKTGETEEVQTEVETPTEPVNTSPLTCKDGYCTINLGKYSLTGVPENYNDLVETSGLAAGTDILNDLLFQLADQLAAEGLTEQSEKVKKLAVVGHNMARIEQTFEELATNCNYDKACIQSYKYKTMPKPSGFDETYFPYTPKSYLNALFELEVGRYYQKYDQTEYNNLLKENNLSVTFTSIYDSVLGDSKIPDSIKGVAQELGWDIAHTGGNYGGMLYIYMTNQTKFPITDFMTGTTTTLNYTSSALGDKIFNYNADIITDLDSSIICGSAHYQDTGTQCH